MIRGTSQEGAGVPGPGQDSRILCGPGIVALTRVYILLGTTGAR